MAGWHLLHQGPVVAGLLRAAWASAGRRLDPSAVPPASPGPWVRATLPPRPDALVDAFHAWVGCELPGEVHPLLFPQWAFPALGATLQGLPWPLTRVLNQGFQARLLGPIPRGVGLTVTARLASVVVDGSRVRLEQEAQLGTEGGPTAVELRQVAVIPLPRAQGTPGGPRTTPSPDPAHADLVHLDLTPRHAREFACLTGDVNPIHWLPPAARAAGFRSPILHGFATAALAFEVVVARALHGDRAAVRELEVRFLRPLTLPRRVVVQAGPAGEAVTFAVTFAVADPADRAVFMSATLALGGARG